MSEFSTLASVKYLSIPAYNKLAIFDLRFRQTSSNMFEVGSPTH